MRLLHVSDLHLDPENESDCRLLVGAMLRDMEAHAKEVPFDLVVFSGDLAKAGTAEELLRARELLLGPLQKRLGLAADRLLLCPGNHDVDRDGIRQMGELGLAQGLTDPEALDRLAAEPAELEEAVARLSPWRSFLGSCGGIGVGTDTDP